MRPDRRRWGFTAGLALALTACPSPVTPPDGGGAGGGGGGGGVVVDGGVVDAGPAKSAKANVRFKGDVRFTLDLSVGLALPLDQLCNELGQYACVGVHTVALQGVDPYAKGLFEPVPVTGVTAPIVVDRMVLSACLRRVELDLGQPADAVIFKDIAVAGGKLVDAKGAAVQQAVVELARRAWLRDPTSAEVARLEQLALDVAAQGGVEPAKQWMQAACFAVFSSEEAIFY